MNAPVVDASPLAGTTALVVAHDASARVFLASTLKTAGLLVTEVSSFGRARWVLAAQPPSVLVTEMCLGAHNGLHLALIGRLMRPDMAVVVTAPFGYEILRRDADAVGAAFVSGPITSGELLAALFRTAVRESKDAILPALAVPAPGERRRGHRKRQRDIATFLLLAASRR